ncbi:demethylmenaquinone methyltransferase / 2-methoxy-6-polyprenyl-1,4-benzoquinol methylase [Halorubrum aquaticum]|uniref:Demethylmenaquinone methyltransferase / 2-methoxy-6-polyprenyl-1,4-benzoquinol methylase n=1 Tax=Halorubrum aquaticum TaxID=387340 RepID=A0A1I3BJE3_9EURY|nr:methyltransferase domain-containing protein [Halorubrum aquaticum]SFH62444.1 demethylmenaquinone methyltransferase / 2-methoxy-6-polyprenyl-1,4-benzoquinol methylase [Halorubrum aquaticum]
MYGLGDVRFFDRIAPLYDLVMPSANGAALSAGFDRAERPIDRLLDVGGGSGRASAALTGPEITVVDVSSGMLRRARTARGLSAVVGDAGRLPFRDDGVDAAMVVDAFHHLPDREAALREAARVIAPGGVLVVREFDPTHPLGRLLVAGEHAIGMGSRFSTPDALADDMEAAGFDPAVVDRGFGYTVAGVRLDRDGTA